MINLVASLMIKLLVYICYSKNGSGKTKEFLFISPGRQRTY